MLSQLMEALVKSEQLFGFEQQHDSRQKNTPQTRESGGSDSDRHPI